VKHGRGRPRKNPLAASGTPVRPGAASIPVAASDLATRQAFVDTINPDGKAELRYAENGGAMSVTQ